MEPRPLELIECELLEAIARNRDDEEAMTVLADYWLQKGDEAQGAYLHLQCGELGQRIDLAEEEARLAEHAMRWRLPALRAGYAESDLVFDRGVLQWPLAVAAGGPLDDNPDIIRVSPRYYRELRQVCDGRDAEVVEAEAVTPLTTERVAIKAVSRYWPGREPYVLLEREHAILRRIRHPNLPRVLGWAIRPHGRALVLSWGGIDLRTLVRATRQHDRRLGVAFALSVACQVCDALDALHGNGVVHREIRPDHVLVGTDGTVTVIDFGYVTAAEPMWPNARYGYGPGGISPGAGYIAPGLRYMSPEQVTGRALDGCTDIFSLALTMCELVDGEHPVRDTTNDFEILIALRECRLVFPEVPPRVAEVLRRAVARRRRERYASGTELRTELVRAAAASRLDVGPHVIAQLLCELGVRA